MAMRVSVFLARAAIACVTCILFGGVALAIDLNGLWSSDASACDRIFEKKGNSIAFRQDSDMYGSGFIIDGRRIRGSTASCNITTRKEVDAVIHMVASCATDIMYSNMQFSVRVLDDNRVSRIFPGIDGMELTYHRCPPQ
jgi:hypothetical protein